MGRYSHVKEGGSAIGVVPFVRTYDEYNVALFLDCATMLVERLTLVPTTKNLKSQINSESCVALRSTTPDRLTRVVQFLAHGADTPSSLPAPKPHSHFAHLLQNATRGANERRDYRTRSTSEGPQPTTCAAMLRANGTPTSKTIDRVITRKRYSGQRRRLLRQGKPSRI